MEFIATRSQLEVLANNMVWQDIVATIQERIELIRTELETPEDMRRNLQENDKFKSDSFIRAEIYTLRYILSLPEMYASDTASAERRDEDG